MATFVLIHGGWHGGWCWRKVIPPLQSSGHDVFAPTLTGLGERAHLAHPDVDLETHIQDIVNAIWYEDLRDVIAVCHSYGGMVLTGVAERMPERFSHLVYLDAFVPEDGQSVLDLLPPDRRGQLVSATQDGWRVPSGGAERFGISDSDDLAWVRPRLVDQPLATLEQPVRCPDGAVWRLTRTYIYCTQFGASFTGFAERAQHDPGWRYHELATGHDAMITMPEALAELLLEAAGAMP